MKAFAAVVFVFLSCVSYYGLALVVGLYQRFPVTHFILAGLGIASLIWLVKEGATLGRITGLILALVMLGLFAWHTLVYSVYDPITLAVEAQTSIGPRLDGLELVAHTGGLKPVWASSDRATLIVFYRGFW